VECDVILTSRADALRHRDLTEHKDVIVTETDKDAELRELGEAVIQKRTVLANGLVLCEGGQLN
jgi:hypothetical protein